MCLIKKLSGVEGGGSGWRDGWAVKGTVHSSRGPEFNSQLLHGGSQAYIMESNALFCHSGLHSNRVLINIKYIFKKMKKPLTEKDCSARNSGTHFRSQAEAGESLWVQGQPSIQIKIQDSQSYMGKKLPQKRKKVRKIEGMNGWREG